jgi:aminoglycoside phosphotransferase
VALTLASSIEHARRRSALLGCGLDPELPMARAWSYANEVWVGDELVLRINARGVGRLAREAAIAARVPREARYPEIVGVDNDGEIEWMVTRRAPGRELGRAWPAMSVADRERAIHELAGMLAALHATPIAGIPDDIRPPHTLPLAALLALIDEVCPEPDIAGALADFVRARWDAFDDALVLVHGDPHLENVLWDGSHVTALLDLEWSRPSWVHCDVEILLAIAESPRLFAAADYEAELDPAQFADLPRWLVAAQPAWFEHPRLAERLDVLYVSRTLGSFEDASPDDPVDHWRWSRLAEIVAGHRSFATLLAGLRK